MIGRVSKGLPNELDDQNREVSVVVSPETYYDIPFLGRQGVILGAIDIKSLYFVLLRVKGYSRRDASSVLYGSEVSSIVETAEEEPGSLVTNVVVKCEAMTQLDLLNGGEPEAANVVIEPQSPVIIPKENLVSLALGLNRGELSLGFLEDGVSRVKVGFSLDDFNYHMLVVGTTGAGKTSFVKDILAQLSLMEEGKTSVMILDASGDYYNVVLPPDFTKKAVSDSLEDFARLHSVVMGVNVRLLFPLSKSWIRKYELKKVDPASVAETYFRVNIEPIVDYLREEGQEVSHVISDNVIRINVGDRWRSRLEIIPFWFSYPNMRWAIPYLNPYFTEQASHFLRIIQRSKDFEDVDSLSDFIKRLSETQEKVYGRYKIHKNTWENIMRGLGILRETRLFDIEATSGLTLREALSSPSPINVVDLYNSEMNDFSKKIVTHYLLDEIFTLRENAMKGGRLKDRMLVVIDEAHTFFPSRNNADDETYMRKVSGKISLMMRLGRRRRLGFLFVTHDPTDLNDLVVQLANTKVIFRVKEEIGERLGLSRGDAKSLVWEKNGVAFVISPVFREGYVKVRAPVPAPLGHYDLSRT